MHQQLSDLIKEYDHAESRLETLANRITDDHWSKRNDPDRWSPAECVAHLNLTSAAYIPLIRKAIEEARQLPRTGSARYKRDFLGWIFAKMTGPLPKIGRMRIGRVKTTAPFVPTGNHPKQQLLAQFKRDQLELVSMIREGDGLALDKVKIRSPFGGKIQYDCFSAMKILPRHQERHLQQAELVWG
jgi:hypothetical protein